MPHVYDTGLAVAQRTAVRNAVVARLSRLKKPALYLRAVGVLPRRVEGDDEGIDEIARALGGATPPAMLVALGRGTHAGAGMPAVRARKEIEVAVYVISAHTRDTVQGRLAGDVAAANVTADPGIDTMLEHAEELLVGFDLGVPGAGVMRPESEQEIFSGDDATVWELSFVLQVDRSINHARSVTQLLTEIQTETGVDGVGDAVSVTRTPIGAP